MNSESCEERIDDRLKDRIKNLRKLWNAYRNGTDDIFDYGLCFDYVPPDGKENGYFRYQLSWGGPADEFRFYCDENFNPTVIEYWFLDWFDGASRVLSSEDEKLLVDIFQMFKDAGAVENEYSKVMKF